MCRSPNSEPSSRRTSSRPRHRDRHVDADHADLDLVLELPGGAAVVGEDRGAVAVRVVVDERERLVVGATRGRRRAPGRRSRRCRSRHVGGDVSISVGPRKKPSASPSTSAVAAVDDDRRALGRHARRCRRDLVAVLARDSGPMSESASMPSPTFSFGRSARRSPRRAGRRPSPTATTTRSPCSARRPSRSRRDRGVGRHVESASGSTTMWFFAPPSACTRLPCARAVS
jgi:hypothetical protein